MSRFFKKTLSFFGLSDEANKGIRDKKDEDAAGPEGRMLRDKSGKIDSRHAKKNLRRRSIIDSKPPRKVLSIGSVKGEVKSRVFVAEPKEFGEIQIIADNFKDDIPIIINLHKVDQDIGKRVIDYCSGLTYALEGNIRKVSEKVFLITPYNVEVSSEEKELMEEKGF